MASRHAGFIGIERRPAAVRTVSPVSAESVPVVPAFDSALSMRVIAETASVLRHRVNPASMFIENLRQIAAACDRAEIAPQGGVLTICGTAVCERYS